MKSNKKPKMKFLESAFNEIINTIGSRPAESGGLLFGNEEDLIVRKFVFDKKAKTTPTSYTFDTDFLNPEIKRLWKEEGLSCIGFIHSHPPNFGRLSSPDIAYFSSMFDLMPRKQYLTPIVFTSPDGGFKLHPFILPDKAKETIVGQIEILPDDFFETREEEIENVVEIVQLPKVSLVTRLLQDLPYQRMEMLLRKAWLAVLSVGLTYFLLKFLYIITTFLDNALL